MDKFDTRGADAVQWYKKLRAARIAAGLTQTDVARALGVTKQSYGQYERGERIPNIVLCRDICDIIGVTVDSLLY